MSDSASSTFDVDRLRHLLGPDAARFDVRDLAGCASTNAVLLEPGARATSGTLVVADRQTAGRGRRGRSWQSAGNASLTASLAWRFTAPVSALSPLPLVVGLALAEGLDALGARGVLLKWPNDLVVADPGGYRKLAGVLVELCLSGRSAMAIIGFGINLRRFDANAALDAPMAALGDLLAPSAPSPARENVLASVLPALARRLDEFSAHGFVAAADWTARHALHACDVLAVQTGAAALAGRCLGVDADGALRLATGTGVVRVIAADVSLRPR